MDAATPAQRYVWIVGSFASGHRYHRADCYVLEQTPHHGRARKVGLAELPDVYQPCQICAPGGRLQTSAAATGLPAQPQQGVQPGHVVRIEDVVTGEVSSVRLVWSNSRSAPDEVTVGSPLGSALRGKDRDEVAEFKLPSGRVRRVRVVDYGSRGVA